MFNLIDVFIMFTNLLLYFLFHFISIRYETKLTETSLFWSWKWTVCPEGTHTHANICLYCNGESDRIVLDMWWVLLYHSCDLNIVCDKSITYFTIVTCAFYIITKVFNVRISVPCKTSIYYKSMANADINSMWFLTAISICYFAK